MFLRLDVNGKDGLFLVDTGAGISVVDTNQSTRFGFKYSHGMNYGNLEGIGGSQELVTVGSLDIAYAGFEIKEMRLYGADLSSVNRHFEARNMRIFGILGSDFLKKHGAVVDYGSSEIHFKRSWTSAGDQGR